MNYDVTKAIAACAALKKATRDNLMFLGVLFDHIADGDSPEYEILMDRLRRMADATVEIQRELEQCFLPEDFPLDHKVTDIDKYVKRRKREIGGSTHESI